MQMRGVHSLAEGRVHVWSWRMLCRDVLQIDSRMLLSRKLALVIRTVDPVVLQQAGVGIYHGLVGKCA